MHPMLTIAVRAARNAGRIISRASFDMDAVKVSRKQEKDFVTEVDQAAELEIITTLKSAYPSHAILAEESGRSGIADEADIYAAENIWIIDPLDGTTNFIHGLPHYAVSIGLMQRGVMTQAVVYDPNRDELFTATKGRGAFVNDRRIRVAKRTNIDDALIGTGFPFRAVDDLPKYMKMFESVTRSCAAVRRPGAAALDLAYVAAGRYDGFFELGLSPWDVAAGSLLVLEAGGLIGDFKGDGNGCGYITQGEVVAASPRIDGPLLKALAV
jgi:myo-inositol-1(or 4)-monophosphatase